MTPISTIAGLVAVTLAVTAAVAMRPRHPQIAFEGTAAPLDGDTIDMHGVRIRLYGIDAPEFGQECTLPDNVRWPCGLAAMLHLSDVIARKTVTCRKIATDRYGRPVATCRVEGKDISAAMVRSGYAIAYRRYSEAYVDDEKAARVLRVGIWNSTFEEPELWRRKHGR